MPPLRYSINVSLDGCVDHAAAFSITPETHQHATDWLADHDVALFGRVTYQLMEAWRPDEQGRLGDWVEPWMESFAQVVGDVRKVVVSSTLEASGWSTEVVPGDDLVAVVRRLKEEGGRGIALGGVTLPLALARLGLIDEYQLVVHPVVVGHGPYLFEGLADAVRLVETGHDELPGGVVARRFVPVAPTL